MVPLCALIRLVQVALTLDVTVDYENQSLRGRAGMTVENRGAQTGEASFLLGRLMHVAAVTSAGKPLRFSQEVVIFDDEPMRQVLQLRVSLPKPLPPQGRTAVEIEYGGPLVGYAETGSLYVKDRIDPAFTILRREALAFPVVGVPSRKANRAVREPDFSFAVTVRVPPGQKVATGGRLIAHDDGKWRFEAAQAPFLNIAIAPYVTREEGGIRVHALPADAATAGPLLEATRRALGILAEWYGPLEQKPELSIAEIEPGFGSQASLSGGIILEPAAFTDVKHRRELYHELSHLWNPPSLEQPWPRWTEGLATWLEFRMARIIDGAGDIDAVSARTRKRLCDSSTRLADVPFRRYGEKDMTDWSYSVGFLMFRDWEVRAGAGAVDAALKDLFQGHRKGMTLEDLHRAMPEDLWQRWMETTAWTDGICG
jgi:hypothetical protein